MAIAATLRPADAAARVWDAVVIGAGPAGSVAARESAHAGLSVLLVDHACFPRPKVCGCCLNANALATLAEIGLGSLVRQCGAVPLRSLNLAASKSQATIPFSGVALSRDAFDAALVQAAIDGGVHFLPETRASLAPIADPLHRICVLRHGGEETNVASRIVVGAGGLGSRLSADERQASIVESASRLGAGVILDRTPAFFRAETVYMACAGGGYVGLVRLEDGRLNIAAAFDVAFVKHAGGLGNAATCVLGQAGFPVIDGLASHPWHGTPRLTRHASRPAAHRLFLLGDAASFVEPFTGEGMAWGLASGSAVVPFLARGCRHWDAGLIEKWTTCYRRKIGRRQYACRLAAGVLRRPNLARAAVTLVRYFPLLAAPVLRYINQAKHTSSFAL